MMLSRDVAYLAALFGGAAFSVLLYGRANRSLSLFFVLLSASIAALSWACCGGPSPLRPDLPLLYICVAIFLVTAAALRFPFAFGVPLTVALGSCVVFFAYCFLVPAPLLEGRTLGFARMVSAGQAEIRFRGDGARALSLDGSSLSAEFLVLTIDPHWPFVQDRVRGDLTGIVGRSGERLLPSTPAVFDSISAFRVPGITVERKRLDLSFGSASPGSLFALTLRGEKPVIEPR